MKKKDLLKLNMEIVITQSQIGYYERMIDDLQELVKIKEIQLKKLKLKNKGR